MLKGNNFKEKLEKEFFLLSWLGNKKNTRSCSQQTCRVDTLETHLSLRVANRPHRNLE